MSQMKNLTPLAKFVFENSSGATNSSIAASIGISQPYLSSILKGKKVPSVEVANKIARYFNVPNSQIHALLGWSDSDANEDAIKELQELTKKDESIFELVGIYSKITSIKDKKRAINIIKNFIDSKG